MSGLNDNGRQKRNFKPIVFDLVEETSKLSNDEKGLQLLNEEIGLMPLNNKKDLKSSNDERCFTNNSSVFKRIGEKLKPEDARAVINARRPGPRKAVSE
jgi:hypothetical protein